MREGSRVSGSREDEAPPSLHAQGLARLAAAADRVGAPAGLRAALQQPARLTALWLPGPAGPVAGWWAQQSLDLPTLGGFAQAPGLSADAVRAAALWTHLQAAAVGLSVGGGFGGLAAPPGLVSAAAVGRAWAPVLGDSVVGAERGTDAAWLGRWRGALGPGAPVVGLPEALGGSALRAQAVARGGQLVLDRFLRQVGWARPRLRVAVHGDGAVGRAAVAVARAAGLRVVAVCDAEVGAVAEGGLDPARLAGGLGAAGVPTTPAGVLAHDAEVLILASGAGVVDAAAAHQIKARVIVELARFAIAPEADAVLLDRRVAVLPHLVAGAGGLVMDHALWQGRGAPADDEALANALAAQLDRAFRALWAAAVGEGLPARTAALTVALRRLSAQHQALHGPELSAPAGP